MGTSWRVLRFAAAAALVGFGFPSPAPSRAEAAPAELPGLPAEGLDDSVLPFLAPEMVVALHLRPAQAVETPLAKLLVSALAPQGKEDPADPTASLFRGLRIREAGLFLDRAKTLDGYWLYADARPTGRAPTSFLIVLRSRVPLSARTFGEQWARIQRLTEAEADGKKLLVDEASAHELGSPFAIHQVDPRTVVAGPQDALLKALAARPGRGALAEKAAQRKFVGQLRIVAVADEAVRPLLSKAAEGLRAFPLVGPYDKLPPLLPKLVSASLEADLAGSKTLVAEATLEDAAAGAKLKEALDEVWVEAKILLGFSAQQVQTGLGPEIAALVREVREKAAISPQGTATTFVLDRPAALDPAARKVFEDVLPKARAAAQRTLLENNLRMVLLALHQHHDAHKKLPRDVVAKDGKPLLSWRTQLLPYLEEKDLFDEIKPDEAWDGPRNKPLLARMPQVFRTAGAKPGCTSMFFLKGPTTLSEKHDARFEAVTDGTSNTLMVVVAQREKAVPWAQPNDLDFNPEKAADFLAALPEKEILVGYFDGSVAVWKERPRVEVLKALVSVSGGEKVERPE